jgi:uncharacterized lipoprotein YddW (UPF0748 family)
MLKKIFSVFLFLLITPAVFASDSRIPDRAVFVSMIQEPQILSSKEGMDTLVTNCKKIGAKTLFIQIYRENKSWFSSRIGDSSFYDSAIQKIGEDPLAYLIKKAHSSNIQVHAWVNLMSLGTNENAPILKKYGPEILTRNLENKKSLNDYKVDNQFFLEPGDPRIRRDLTYLVEEITAHYRQLDGIQFDYIRYPDWQPNYGYTNRNVARFKRAYGAYFPSEESHEWRQWKRDQVTTLLKQLTKKAKSIHPGILVSTTGLVPYSRASQEAFQDWLLWVRSGDIDFLTLMAYSQSNTEFDKYLKDAKKQFGVLDKVSIAVGAYMFRSSPKDFEKQWKACEESGSRACVVFHYESILENKKMMESLSTHE